MDFIRTFLMEFQNLTAPALPDLCIPCLVFIAWLIWSKLEIPVMEGIFWLAMTGITALLCRGQWITFSSSMGSALAIFYLTGLVTAAEMYLIRYLPLTFSDVFFLAYLVFYIRGSMGFLNMKDFFLLAILWTAVCMIAKRRWGKVILNSVPCFLCYGAGLAGYALFNVLFGEIGYPGYVSVLDTYQPSPAIKMLILAVMAAILFAALAFCFALINRLFHFYFAQLTHYGKKYKELSRYTFWMPFGICGVLLFLFCWCIGQEMPGYWYYVEDMISILVILLLGSQMLTVRMLLNSVKLKEHLLQEEVHREQMTAYNSQLASNLENLRVMKHDMKNVFLTMGEYVKRSQDEEMKAYYRNHIVPFAGQEFKMNDLYVRLQEIRNEPLRAFFYYKCMQGMEQEVNLQLRTQMDGSYFGKFYEAADLARILGIFMDNAIEEALYTKEKRVEVTVREQNGCMSIRIWNQVREETLHRGVHAGTTTKGLGRGKGLEIAEKLIRQYDDLLWNSYFQEDGFVQVLSAGLAGSNADLLA